MVTAETAPPKPQSPGGIDPEERKKYLEDHFPKPAPTECHAPGVFTERAFIYLSKPIPVLLERSGEKYVVVDAMESNENPVREVVRFRFRLTNDGSRGASPTLGGLEVPLQGEHAAEAVFSFFFSSEFPFDENVENLKVFVSEHLGDPLVRSARPDTDGKRLFFGSLAFAFLGVIGLIGMAFVAILQNATQVSFALAIAAFTAIAIIGIVIAGWSRNGRIDGGRGGNSPTLPLVPEEEAGG